MCFMYKSCLMNIYIAQNVCKIYVCIYIFAQNVCKILFYEYIYFFDGEDLPTHTHDLRPQNT